MNVYEYSINCNYNINVCVNEIDEIILSYNNDIIFSKNYNYELKMSCLNCINEFFYYGGAHFYSVKKLNRKELNKLKKCFKKITEYWNSKDI